MTYKKETELLHAGFDGDAATGAVAVPIYQTTSYHFKDSEHAANLFALKEFGNIYTRLMNPTTDVLEKRVAALDGGVGSLAVSSGQSAITIAILNIAKAGDEIVAANNLYGGTYSLFKYTFAKFGIKVHFAESSDLNSFKSKINSKTKAIYTELIGNPKLNVTDVEALSKIAHEAGVPLIVDNTATPYIFRPFEHGADVVIYSATKFLGGHGNSIAGVIVDSGKFPFVFEKEASYHDLDFNKAFGNLAYIIKARVTLLRDLGSCLSPFNAFLIIQGLETLHLRMERHCENALKVAQFLEKHSNVLWVNYPGLDSSTEKVLANKYLKKGAGAIIGFGIKGGKTAGVKFIDSLKLLSHVANIGDAKSLAIHPASTTHQQLSEEEQVATGVTADFIRLSIGIENIEDILGDIEQALRK